MNTVSQCWPMKNDPDAGSNGRFRTLSPRFQRTIPETDMPRSRTGITPDVIVNPHSIPSRMTMGQLMEAVGSKAAACYGAYVDGTAFGNVGNSTEIFGTALEAAGYERYGNEILYNGITGDMMEVSIFMTPTYYMRLKHMPIDKINARAEGRRVARTHQTTGGRGNQGGLRIGEMERDVVVAYGTSNFMNESMMTRGDKYETVVCDGCGSIPIYNVARDLYVCPECDGQVKFLGDTENTMRLVPPNVTRATGFTNVNIPYTLKLSIQEMECIGSMSFRILTASNAHRLGHGSGLSRITNTTAALPAIQEAADKYATALDAATPFSGPLDLYDFPDIPKELAVAEESSPETPEEEFETPAESAEAIDIKTTIEDMEKELAAAEAAVAVPAAVAAPKRRIVKIAPDEVVPAEPIVAPKRRIVKIAPDEVVPAEPIVAPKKRVVKLDKSLIQEEPVAAPPVIRKRKPKVGGAEPIHEIFVTKLG